MGSESRPSCWKWRDDWLWSEIRNLVLAHYSRADVGRDGAGLYVRECGSRMVRNLATHLRGTEPNVLLHRPSSATNQIILARQNNPCERGRCNKHYGLCCYIHLCSAVASSPSSFFDVVAGHSLVKTRSLSARLQNSALLFILLYSSTWPPSSLNPRRGQVSWAGNLHSFGTKL
jgi:hypothetical protein